ncbi:MAG: DUF2147 domain-containing protein [Prolixibacteraceae bacterium]|nr:DUF2147 domain-containing protein [Prolixibacteraceae bacterium]
MKKSILIVMITILTGTLSFAQEEILGKWKTIDDATGEPKSVVDIRIEDGKMYGKIIKLFNEDPNYDPVCDECTDHLKDQKIIGMQIINGLTLEKGKWEGKKGILDPDNGKYYDVKIWVDEDDPTKLNVRGYILFLYRTQTWVREV